MKALVPRGLRGLPALPDACLLVLDLQFLFTDPASPACVPAWEGRREQAKALVRGFIERGLPVLPLRHAHPRWDRGGTMGMFWERLQRPDDPLSALDRSAADLPEGLLVLTKRRLSAMSVPAVVRAARAAGTVVIIGVQTHLCVLATAVEAARFSVRPVVVSDAVAARDQSLHEAALAVLASGHAHVATTREVLDALRPPEGRYGRP